MAKLSARGCETAKPEGTGKDRFLGDGDGLFLRVRPNGTKTWIVEYEFRSRRRKYTVGVFDAEGSPGGSIASWLTHGRLSLAQARAIAGHWKLDRLAGRDPVSEWEAHLACQRAKQDAVRQLQLADAERPTVRVAVDQFLAKQINGKKSAHSIRYRLDRLTRILGDRKIRDVSTRDVIAAIEKSPTVSPRAGLRSSLRARFWFKRKDCGVLRKNEGGSKQPALSGYQEEISMLAPESVTLSCVWMR
jgi:hypothetical protein